MSLDVYLEEYAPTEVYWANITHNLNKMADEAGIYQAMWRPEEIGATQARHIIDILEEGLSMLLSNPEYFEQFRKVIECFLFRHFPPDPFDYFFMNYFTMTNIKSIFHYQSLYTYYHVNNCSYDNMSL